jgi:hypothetical protein
LRKHALALQTLRCSALEVVRLLDLYRYVNV